MRQAYPYPPQPEFGWTPPPPPRRRWGRVLVWVVALPVLGVVIGGGAALLTKDGGGDEAACKTALAANYREAMAAGPDAPSAAAPSSCTGLSEATLRRITGEVVSEYLESDQADEDINRLIEEGMASATP